MTVESIPPVVALADTKAGEPIVREPLVIRWGEPFVVIPDLAGLHTSKSATGYRAIDVPLSFDDGTATGKLKFVLFGVPPPGHGYDFEGLDFHAFDREERATLPLHVNAELDLTAPIGYSVVRFTATSGTASYVSNRTSVCGAIGPASPYNRSLYFGQWKKEGEGLDPNRAGVLDLYLPQEPSTFEQVQFQFDRFFADARYYQKYPVTNTAIDKYFGYSRRRG